jgi:cyclic pyranopterin monophosphate synthase
MVDVGSKPDTARRAVARALVRMAPSTATRVAAGDAPKGDVLGAARLAGIMAAKRTSDLIPLCHPLPLTSVDVELETDPTIPGVRAIATARVDGKTGVEMEALTAVSVALLTVYDMCKAVDRGMTIERIRLLRKEGGRSGTWKASESDE